MVYSILRLVILWSFLANELMSQLLIEKKKKFIKIKSLKTTGLVQLEANAVSCLNAQHGQGVVCIIVIILLY